MSDFEKNLELAINNAKRLSNKMLIDGKLTSAKSSNKIEVINPSTGENIGAAPQCDKNDRGCIITSLVKTLSVLGTGGSQILNILYK